MNQPISQYGCKSLSNSKVSTHQFESTIYVAYEKLLYKLYHSAKPNKYLFFKSQTLLPNDCKFPKSPKREIFCAVLTTKNIFKIKDVFIDFNTHDYTDNIALHSINREIIVFVGGANGPISLPSKSSLRIEKGEGRESKMTFSTDQIPTMLVLEAYYRDPVIEIPTKCIEHWSYNVSEEQLNQNYSFLRMNMTITEIRAAIRFIAVEYVATRNPIKPKQSPISISITNYEGKLIKNSIIAPRETIMHLQSEGHHLTKEDIINGWDEVESMISVRKTLDQTILVGTNIKKFIDVFQIPIERILGIRDLTNSICFEEAGIPKMKDRYRLLFLRKHFIHSEIRHTTTLQTEKDVLEIRLVYLCNEDRWKDHIHPEVRAIMTTTPISPLIDPQPIPMVQLPTTSEPKADRIKLFDMFKSLKRPSSKSINPKKAKNSKVIPTHNILEETPYEGDDCEVLDIIAPTDLDNETKIKTEPREVHSDLEFINRECSVDVDIGGDFSLSSLTSKFKHMFVKKSNKPRIARAILEIKDEEFRLISATYRNPDTGELALLEFKDAEPN